MDSATFASVIAEMGLTRCISATVTMASGTPGLAIGGVTDLAAREIKAVVLAALAKRGIRLPSCKIMVDLVFDVPFETTSELAFATYVSLAETICRSSMAAPFPLALS